MCLATDCGDSFFVFLRRRHVRPCWWIFLESYAPSCGMGGSCRTNTLLPRVTRCVFSWKDADYDITLAMKSSSISLRSPLIASMAFKSSVWSRSGSWSRSFFCSGQRYQVHSQGLDRRGSRHPSEEAKRHPDLFGDTSCLAGMSCLVRWRNRRSLKSSQTVARKQHEVEHWGQVRLQSCSITGKIASYCSSILRASVQVLSRDMALFQIRCSRVWLASTQSCVKIQGMYEWSVDIWPKWITDLFVLFKNNMPWLFSQKHHD